MAKRGFWRLSGTVQILEQRQKKRKRGRPRLSDALVSFRLPFKDLDMFNAIAQFEGRDKAELMRSLFLQLKKEYRRDRAFRRWVERNAEQLGVNLEEFW